jgi:hypothetical protein
MAKTKKKPDLIEEILKVSEECVMKLNSPCRCRAKVRRILKRIGVKV